MASKAEKSGISWGKAQRRLKPAALDQGEIIYQSEDGRTNLDVHLREETVWLTQSQMVGVFQRTKQNISPHIRNIFKEAELQEDSVVKEYLTTATDGKQYKLKYYNLDVIISVGYRVKSRRGTQFHIWATSVLKNHLIKGYPLSQKRLVEKGPGGLGLSHCCQQPEAKESVNSTNY